MSVAPSIGSLAPEDIMRETLNGHDLWHIGLQYFPSFVSEDEQRELEQMLASLRYRDILMRGMVAKRKVCCFGFDYVYSRRDVVPTVPMPELIGALRERVERLVCDGSAMNQAIVTSYPAGAGINWHTDSPVFGPSIVGISLGAEARLLLRHGNERHRILLPSGSAYARAGVARSAWQHRVAPVPGQRYSITFRSLRQT